MRNKIVLLLCRINEMNCISNICFVFIIEWYTLKTIFCKIQNISRVFLKIKKISLILLSAMWNLMVFAKLRILLKKFWHLFIILRIFFIIQTFEMSTLFIVLYARVYFVRILSKNEAFISPRYRMNRFRLNADVRSREMCQIFRKNTSLPRTFALISQNI